MLVITPEILIPDNEIEEAFIRASGPGGQNVNKVATAVQIRFDVRSSVSLPQDVRDRLLKLAANRITTDGILVIEAKRFRTQERNRQDARDRLQALILRAAVPPKRRKKTRAPESVNLDRLDNKKRRGRLKRQRRSNPLDDS